MRLYSILSDASGCDPEFENLTVYRERPTVDDYYNEVREWTLPDRADDGRDLYALGQRTARCCGIGVVFKAISDDFETVRAQATILSALHDAPLTDSEHAYVAEGDEPPASHYAVLLSVEDAFEPYIYTPDPFEAEIERRDIEWELDGFPNLSEDVFEA